jgi:hypothetical protein
MKCMNTVERWSGQDPEENGSQAAPYTIVSLIVRPVPVASKTPRPRSTT